MADRLHPPTPDARAIAEQIVAAYYGHDKPTSAPALARRIELALSAAADAARQEMLKAITQDLNDLPPHVFNETGERRFISLDAALSLLRARDTWRQG